MTADAVPEGSAENFLSGASQEKVPDRDRDLDRARKKDDLGLRKIVARGALVLMALQIIAADSVFIVYAVAERWHLEVAAIQAWLAATVIQVVSVVLVITRYLFPAGGFRD